MSEEIRDLKISMLKVYGEHCWMDYTLTRDNPMTAHHIKERRNGGKDVWENISLVSRDGHSFLNFLDRCEHKTYVEFNGLFTEQNKKMQPPDEDYYDELERIYVRRVERCSPYKIILPSDCYDEEPDDEEENDDEFVKDGGIYVRKLVKAPHIPHYKKKKGRRR